ncbi:LacI family DNA-binding transcriptional regulator, partial [Alicyclobacillus mali (ex Roth et al. 2021)]|uniref:LacI family DNA-binding transcriptional regulator n=1 Tax=Alicyclobacillus mali (ex Roth et al. 2021) TaxID=1123961 RepID=UPI001A8F3B08
MATVKDIAKLAGVSPATVSWALNGTRPVSEKTRKRIFEAVKQLNYHPKMSARSLRAGKVFSIGIYLMSLLQNQEPLCGKGFSSTKKDFTPTREKENGTHQTNSKGAKSNVYIRQTWLFSFDEWMEIDPSERRERFFS